MKTPGVFFSFLLMATCAFSHTITFEGKVTHSDGSGITGIFAGDKAVLRYNTVSVRSKNILPNGTEFWTYNALLDLSFGSYSEKAAMAQFTLIGSPSGGLGFYGSFSPFDGYKYTFNHLAPGWTSGMGIENGFLKTKLGNPFLSNSAVFGDNSYPRDVFVITTFDSMKVELESTRVPDGLATLLPTMLVVAGLLVAHRRRGLIAAS